MESKEKLKERMNSIIHKLRKEYPNITTSLHHSNPLQLLVATILSAQCTDDRVNKVTSNLFKKYSTAQDFALADLAELEIHIKPTGFYRNKAKSIKNCCAAIVKRFNGEVPGTLEELIQLPGVWRKTANVVLGVCNGIPGIIVDTHVKRLSERLQLTDEKDQDKIEFALMDITQKNEWTNFSFMLIAHGRKICNARKPLCGNCIIEELCPFANKTLSLPRPD